MIGFALMAGLAIPQAAEAAPTATVEELRLDKAVPQEILRRSGFDSVAPEFARELGSARTYAQARRIVVREGSALWKRPSTGFRGGGRPGVI